ncbi:hypothetical protein [Pyrobaculum aerophilum]|uniref:Polysaccharide biosynthesis protein n=2 Tax=Pyrobaculum aerophilum TaxID=13773 RepID=Q8ZYZ3_PYRAE|nr:hypothetical protein [Pyrobaculum aerophilum]AAL62848.1 hypothetical protein PAE0539 [Pyrobaculum aerophilum str. IM2]MCX8137943.1 hypothetical protein [Pyrobaculum aerophilum]HII46273.1 hypothetical protein [Pyrobaculum aerophilum]
MPLLGSRFIALSAGLFTLLASIAYTLVITRRLSTGDLAVLTAVNTALGVAFAFMGYITTWYPRLLSREPQRYNELIAADFMASVISWALYAIYLVLIGVWDVALFAIGYFIILLNSWPAGAYLSIYKQRLSGVLTFISQIIKIIGAFLIRNNPTVYLVLLINMAMSLPTFLSKVARPNFTQAVRFLKMAVKGAPYQTLLLLVSFANAGIIYVIQTGGGSVMLAYYYLLFQITKTVYPSWILTSLMYGSLLKEEDKTRRALLDGAIIIYIHLLVASIMMKTPEWYVALLRPSELDNKELLDAVKFNAIALVIGSFSLHSNTVLLGVEKNIVITLKDKPARAAIYDLATSFLIIFLMHYAVSIKGAVGMVWVFAIWSALSTTYKIFLLGREYYDIVTKLYVPSFLVIVAMYLTPLPLLPYSTEDVISSIVTYIPNSIIIALTTLLYFYVSSKPARIIVNKLLKEIINILKRRSN